MPSPVCSANYRPARTAKSAPERFSRSDVLLPGLVVGLAFIGFFKGGDWARQAPVDLTVLFAAMTCLAGALAILSRSARIPVSVGAAVFVATCLPAMLYESGNSYAFDKRLSLFIPLIIAAGTGLLVNTYRRQQVWIWLHVTVGVVLVVGATRARNDQVSAFSANGSNTIAAGQASGVAVVVLLLLLVSGGLPRWWMKLLALAVSAWLTTALIETGSRGPVIACATAILVVGAVSRGRGRLFRLAAAVGAVAAGWVMLAQATGIGADRITKSLSGQIALTGSRETIWVATLHAIPHHPAGVGWGNLYNVLPPWALLNSGYAQYPHNVVLEVFIEAGWIAGIVLVVVLAASLVRLMRFADHPYGVAMLGIAIFVVLNALVSGDMNDNRMMWAAITMAWVAKKPKEVSTAQLSRRAHGTEMASPGTGKAL